MKPGNVVRGETRTPVSRLHPVVADRTFTVFRRAAAVALPTSNFANWAVQNGQLVNSFAGDTADESVILEGVVPNGYTGRGTLKLAFPVMANTTTATNTARFDAVTEFRTLGAGESGNSDNFDSTADSVDVDFSTTAYEWKTATITLTPATTPQKGDLFRIKVTRDQDHANDDLTGIDALVREYEFYEEV